MKKTLLSLLFLSSALISFAVEIGKNMPSVTVSNWYYQTKMQSGALDCITLFDINSADALPMLRMLETLQSDFQIPFTAVCINGDKAAATPIKKSGPYVISIGADDRLRTRNDIAATESLFPYAVLSKDGIVLWTGHPSELESVIQQVQSGKFSLSTQRKVEVQRKELQMAIQSGLPVVVNQTADKILAISPSDRIAIQAKLMALNALQRQAEIPAFIQTVCRNNPQDLQLRIMEMDMLLRNEKRDEFVAAVQRFNKDFAKPDPKMIRPVAYIIENAPFGLLMPELTFQLAQRAYDSIASKPAMKGNINYAIAAETLARVQSMRGKFTQAVSLQQQALEIRKGTRQEKNARIRLLYYQELLKTK